MKKKNVALISPVPSSGGRFGFFLSFFSRLRRTNCTFSTQICALHYADGDFSRVETIAEGEVNPEVMQRCLHFLI